MYTENGTTITYTSELIASICSEVSHTACAFGMWCASFLDASVYSLSPYMVFFDSLSMSGMFMIPLPYCGECKPYRPGSKSSLSCSGDDFRLVDTARLKAVDNLEA